MFRQDLLLTGIIARWGILLGCFFLERSLGHYLEAFYRAIGVLFWRGAHYLDIDFLMEGGHMTRVLLGKGAYLACLLFQNWLQGHIA